VAAAGGNARGREGATARSDELRGAAGVTWVRIDKATGFETDKGTASCRSYSADARAPHLTLIFGTEYHGGADRGDSTIADGFERVRRNLATTDVALRRCRGPDAKLQGQGGGWGGRSHGLFPNFRFPPSRRGLQTSTQRPLPEVQQREGGEQIPARCAVEDEGSAITQRNGRGPSPTIAAMTRQMDTATYTRQRRVMR